jgi:hypothetical protein
MVSKFTPEEIVAKYEKHLEKERIRARARYEKMKNDPAYVERKRASSRAWIARRRAEERAKALPPSNE